MEQDSTLRPSGALREKLPAFYRENLGSLEPLVAVAEELLADVRAACSDRRQGSGQRRDGGIPSVTASGAGWETLFAGPNRDDQLGTFAALRSFFERAGSRFPPPRQVWSARALVMVEGETLEVRQRLSRCAILIWLDEDLPRDMEDFTVPEWLLPAGVELDAARVRGLKYRGVPPDRARIAGSVFWRRRDL